MDVILTCKCDFDDELLDEKVFSLQQKISFIIQSGECGFVVVLYW